MNINQLLEKYWDGETTLQEEEALKAYFANGEVSEEHRRFAPLFSYYQQSKQGASILDIGKMSKRLKEERKSRLISLPFTRVIMGIAAALTLVFCTLAVIQIQKDTLAQETKYAGKYTVLDEEDESAEAMAITMEALAFLSTKLDKSSRTINNNFKKAEVANIFNHNN